jgi:hypothetical protein
MTGQVALVRERGQDFAVLAVKSRAVTSPQQREELIAFGEQEFGVRTALLADDGRTWGPTDIVHWLSGVLPGQLPWRRFSVRS